MPLPLHSIPRSSQIFTDQLRLRPVDNRLSKSAVRAHYKSVEQVAENKNWLDSIRPRALRASLLPPAVTEA